MFFFPRIGLIKQIFRFLIIIKSPNAKTMFFCEPLYNNDQIQVKKEKIKSITQNKISNEGT